jgi:L-alanine-DL-glutamate epimerase-like enolase superfamily enzyme
VKMRVGKDFGRSEREDIARLAAVRKAVGDDVEIYVDANNGYYAKQAIKMSQIFEQFDCTVRWQPQISKSLKFLEQMKKAKVFGGRKCRLMVMTALGNRLRIDQGWD